MHSFELVAVGELLYALRAPYSRLLTQTRMLSCHCTGAEFNVAMGASRLGLKTAFVSKVCRNFIGRFAVETLQGCDVNTQGVVLAKEGRMGVLYQEYGIPPRPSSNVYDRDDAAFLSLSPVEIEWSVLNGAKCVYISGVTAALGKGPRDVIQEAFRRAKQAGALRVFDANFRSALWSEEEARVCIKAILKQVDICFIKIDDARRVLGEDGRPEDILDKIRNHYGINLVVMTLGADGAIASNGCLYRESAVAIPQMINRFGLGDAFAAGFLYGYFKGELPKALRYATAAAALKSTYTDESFIQFEAEDVEDLIKSQDTNTSLPQGTVKR